MVPRLSFCSAGKVEMFSPYLHLYFNIYAPKSQGFSGSFILVPNRPGKHKKQRPGLVLLSWFLAFKERKFYDEVMEFPIEVIKEKIRRNKLKELVERNYRNMIKIAVDVEKEIIALGGEFHSEGQAELVNGYGSNGFNVWGANIYIDRPREDRIEFNALINIKPTVPNKSNEIESPVVREKIEKIINKLIE